MPVETRFYDILGVQPDASQAEIKKAYKRQALQHHPDRGGSTRKFQELSEACEVLMDDEKRRFYDQYGEDALRQGQAGADGGGAGNAFAADLFGGLFEQFFGHNGFPQRPARSRPRRPEDVAFNLQVQLEELFTGVTKKVAIRRTVVCADCNGTGSSEPQAEYVCQVCRGRGVQVVIRRLGPGMVQQVQTTCQACGGQGRGIPPELVCRACDGTRTQDERNVLDVEIPPGCPDNHSIVFEGAGDHLPDQEVGNIVCIVRTDEHPRFKRRGDHLETSAQISLTEALCGCRVSLKHLDDRELVIRSKPGEVVKPRSWWKVRREGMPVFNDPQSRGDLLLRIEVVFPDKLDAAAAQHLADALASAHVRRPPPSFWRRLLERILFALPRAPRHAPPTDVAGSDGDTGEVDTGEVDTGDGDTGELVMEEVRGMEEGAPGAARWKPWSKL